jgi:predicted Rossmann fold nucleotide-binding protein DprA/Smf involved in DNA uptake
VKSPGSVILKTYDQASIWRDTGHCVISGFHSPIEKECLSILLRGASPIIICPARGMIKRIPSDWERHLDQGLLLILSFFPASETRVTASLAFRRNEYVAALADETWIAHATPGGKVASLNTKSK